MTSRHTVYHGRQATKQHQQQIYQNAGLKPGIWCIEGRTSV